MGSAVINTFYTFVYSCVIDIFVAQSPDTF